MRIPPEFEQLFTVDRRSPPFELARLVDRENAFVSCYLDMRGGKRPAIAFFDQKVGHIRDTLRGVERFHFDCASARVRNAVETNWESGMQGMAIFTPGSEQSTNPIVIHSSTPLDNRLVRFAVPELLPLVAQQQGEPCFDLFWLQDGDDDVPTLRYFEDVGHTHAPRPFGSEKIAMLGFAGAKVASGRLGRSGLQRRDAELRQSSSTATRPLMVAVGSEWLPYVADLMPDWALDRLVGSVEGASADALAAVIGKARASLRAMCRETAARVADVVATDDGLLGQPAVAGYRAALDALLGGHADAVFIADWDKPGRGLPNEAKIEVCMEALRRGVRVILAESSRLREGGGVACLCRAAGQPLLMPEMDGFGGLERVA